MQLNEYMIHMCRWLASWVKGTGMADQTVKVIFEPAHLLIFKSGATEKEIESGEAFKQNIPSGSGNDYARFISFFYPWAFSSNASWLTITPPTSGPKMSFLSEGDVYFSVTANPSTTPRTAVITLSETGGGTLSRTLTVTQDGHVPVTNITGIPATYDIDINLSSAKVVPDNATNKTITWSIVKDTSGEARFLTIDGVLYLQDPSSGKVTIRATIKDGIAPGTDYVKDFVVN